jgi:hypothetical protein
LEHKKGKKELAFWATKEQNGRDSTTTKQRSQPTMNHHDPDRESTEAEREALNRAITQQELRSAYTQWTGNGARASKTFGEWLRTEATEHPALMDMADAEIAAQNAEREHAAEKARASLQAAQDALTAAITALQKAHRDATATESLVLIPLIRAAHDARETANFLAAARKDDADR